MPRISKATRARIYARDGGRCVACGSTDDLTVDHRVPRHAGGSGMDANLQTMCGPCNTRKGGQVPGGMTRRQKRRAHRRGAHVALRHPTGCDPVGGCVTDCPVRIASLPHDTGAYT